MKNKEKKIQLMLFEKIQRIIPGNQALVNIISDSLNISNDAAYRRIRGDKLIDIEETVELCRIFNISLNSLAGTAGDNQISCTLAPLDLHDTNDYLTYIQLLSSKISSLKTNPSFEILFSAADIPLFNFLLYKELTFLNMFSWNKNMYNIPENFEDFVSGINSKAFSEARENIVKCYQSIPSTEIWTSNTIDSTLKLINYHYEMKHFDDKRNPLLICEQLLDMMNTLQLWIKQGSKSGNETKFRFCISEIDIGNTIILFKSNGTTDCLIRLFTINCLNIADKRFCNEAEVWLNNLVKRASLVSGNAEREGFKFFETQKQKIRFLIEAMT